MLFAGGVVIGAVVWSIFSVKPPAAPPGPVMIAYFDRATTDQLKSVPGATGVRFYFAADAPGDARAIIAPIGQAGWHVPEGGTLQFRKYKGLNGPRADVDVLDEQRAEDLVKRSTYSGSGPWSVDCTTGELDRLLAVAGSNAIGLTVTRASGGTYTFVFIPVEIRKGVATEKGTSNNWLTGMPCPSYCVWEANAYLHLRHQ